MGPLISSAIGQCLETAVIARGADSGPAAPMELSWRRLTVCHAQVFVRRPRARAECFVRGERRTRCGVTDGALDGWCVSGIAAGGRPGFQLVDACGQHCDGMRPVRGCTFVLE